MEEDFNHMTDAALVDMWEEFLRSYKEKPRTEFYYMNKILSLPHGNRQALRINYDHLADPEVAESSYDLRVFTSHEPDKSRRTAREAVLRVLKELHPEYYDTVVRSFHVEFSNAPIEKEIPDLNTSDLGTLVKVTGVMIVQDERSTNIVHETVWVCKFGHKNVVHGSDRPKRCKGRAEESAIEGEEEEGPKELEGCDSHEFIKDEKAGYTEDFIRFDIQQRSERTLEAKTPVSLQVESIGIDSVEWVKKHLQFGQNLSITGIPRTKPVKYQSGQGKSIAETYLEASTIEILPETFFEREIDPELDEIIKDTIMHSVDLEENDKLEKEAKDKLTDSIVPSLYMAGQDRIIKTLILMWLVGSDPLKSPDGTRIRGEGQIFILGDPGIGKSRIAEYVRLVRPRVLYNSAGKSSSVGLVGGLNIDKDGIPRISPGVFGLAKNGVVILDEFSDRDQAYYSNLLEPLSDMQTVTIAKGSQYREFQVNTAVLAIANPSTASRYYDPTKSLFENTKIPSTILQRFDVIVIRRDVADANEDKAKARHYFESQKKAVTEEEFYKQRPDKVTRKKETYYSTDYMKKWIAYVREAYHPRVSDSSEATAVIEDWYSNTRKMSITISEEGPKSTDRESSIPAGDMRKLGSVMRLAQMHARCMQRNYVTAEDARVACNYMDLFLAEAGLWRIGDDRQREYKKDSIAEHLRKVEDEWAELRRASFKKAIEKESFEKCYECRGTGEVIEIGGQPEGCVNCNGAGMVAVPFSKNDLIVSIVGAGRAKIPMPQFNTIWKEWEKKNLIIPHDDYGHFRNLAPYTGSLPTPKNKDPKKDLRDRMKGQNPGQWRRFLKDSKGGE